MLQLNTCTDLRFVDWQIIWINVSGKMHSSTVQGCNLIWIHYLKGTMCFKNIQLRIRIGSTLLFKKIFFLESFPERFTRAVHCDLDPLGCNKSVKRAGSDSAHIFISRFICNKKKKCLDHTHFKSKYTYKYKYLECIYRHRVALYYSLAFIIHYIVSMITSYD